MTNGQSEVYDGPFTDMQTSSPSAGNIIDRGDTLTQVRTPYTTAIAVQRPRDLRDVERRVLDESELIGEDGLWGWDVNEKQLDGTYKKKWIEGPSIELAKVLHRNWGNCACPCESVVESQTRYIITPWWIDLETGVTFSRPFRQNKAANAGKGPKGERAEDMKFQIGVSKAMRNVILAGMPAWLVSRAVAKCKESVRLDLEAFILGLKPSAYREMKTRPEIVWSERTAQQQKLVAVLEKKFAKYEVSLVVLETFLGKKAVEWQIEEFIRCTTMVKSLESGASTPQEMFEEIKVDDVEPLNTSGKPAPGPGLNLDLGDQAGNEGHTVDAPKPDAAKTDTAATPAAAETKSTGKKKTDASPE